MSGDYRTLRNAAANAAQIGNHTMALHFATRANQCDYVMPNDWRPAVCYNRGIPLSGPDLNNTKTWGTKRDAQTGAREVSWAVRDVTKVYHRIHGERWGLVDGRFGLVSRSFYNRMLRTKEEGTSA